MRFLRDNIVSHGESQNGIPVAIFSLLISGKDVRNGASFSSVPREPDVSWCGKPR